MTDTDGLISEFLGPADIWHTRDGRAIPVADLADDHLLACIAFCERTERTDVPAFPYLLKERAKRMTNE